MRNTPKDRLSKLLNAWYAGPAPTLPPSLWFSLVRLLADIRLDRFASMRPPFLDFAEMVCLWCLVVGCWLVLSYTKGRRW